MHHTEAGCIHARHFQTADGNIRARIHMLLEHVFVIHLVDMVAGQDDHIFRP